MVGAFGHFEEHVVAAVVSEIQELIKLGYLTDAIEKLFDFIRDFASKAPQNKALSRDALQLSARHARHQKARRHRLPEPEPVQTIIDELIRQVDAVASLARIPLSPELLPPAAVEKVIEAVNEQLEVTPVAGHSPTDLKRLFIRETQQQKPEKLVVAAVDALEHNFKRSGFKLGPVSFDLRVGEITGVVGMNASGKTTMLRCLLSDLEPDAGRISYPALEKERLDWFQIKSRLGYVAQLPDRWYGRVRNNLSFTAAAYGLSGPDNDDLVDWYVHRYGLKAYENAQWDEISGGFKIRFELVRALLTRPRLLVLDEPLAYLDIVTQQIFLHDVRSIASSMERPIPIVITSQHLHEIEAIADRMVILDDGRCLYSGPVGEMPTSREFDMFEVELQAKRSEILSALRPAGLVDLERTMLGWILIFKKAASPGLIQRALLESFGSRMPYYRDITSSTRALFRNQRDDFERAVDGVGK